MPIPQSGSAWPPSEWAPAFAQYDANDAWYSGDVDRLFAIYSGSSGASSRGDDPNMHYHKPTSARNPVRRIVDQIRTWWNGSPRPADERRTHLHAPLAGNLATLSADVLFSEPPAFRLMQKGKPVKGQLQDRLDDLMNAPATRATFAQAGEYAAGLSAVAITVNWDAENTDRPWLGVVACDAVVPEWEGGRLSAVTLWTTHPQVNAAGVLERTLWHMERHEVGQIIHALYAGKVDSLGDLVPLDTIPATAHLVNIPGSTLGAPENDPNGLAVVLPTGIDRLTAAWWRNLPTRQFRKHGVLSNCGRSDFEGVEHYLDQVDFVWSSWMRDIKLARARLVVPETMLDATSTGPAWDDDREVFAALNMTGLPEDQAITAQQFAIRADEHNATLLALTKEVLQHAGYSLASYGEHGDVQKTATEVADRTSATERTRDKKALYFADAIAPLVLALLDIDAAQYGGTAVPDAVAVDIRFPELSQMDPEKEARVFQYLRAAQIASTETLVRERNPDADDDWIREEVAAVVAEYGLGAEVDPGLVDRVDDEDGDNPDAPDDDREREAEAQLSPSGSGSTSEEAA